MPNTRRPPTRSLVLLGLAMLLTGASPWQATHADDTDLYLSPNVANGGVPSVLFILDYRSNLGSTACSGSECDALISGGYLPATGPYTFFDVLRGTLKQLLEPLTNINIGFMLNHSNDCSGGTTSGPGLSGCSNGAYVLHGLRRIDQAMSSSDSRISRDVLNAKLASIPTPGGTLNHSYQGKEVYFELFRYLTAQDVYNGHLGYRDFGNTDRSTNLPDFLPAASWDTSIETSDGTRYITPLTSSDNCSRFTAVNFLFQVSNQEDDSDAAILASGANGGMPGIDLRGSRNNFNTVIRYMNEVDLADGTFGNAPNLDGKQNVTSYFLVAPNQINQTTNGYAFAGGTGAALPLSSDPEELAATLRSILNSVLSVSTTFVAPSIPVNVFNRAQIVDEVFLAIFEADANGFPFWNGNLKKLKIGDAGSGDLQLIDASSPPQPAIGNDGRIRSSAVTYWTNVAALPALEDGDTNAESGTDGKAVARGGAGQKIPGFADGGNPGQSNGPGTRQLFTESTDPADPDGLIPLNADAATASALWSDLTAGWSPAATCTSYENALTTCPAEATRVLNTLYFARGLQDDGTTVRSWIQGAPLHSRPTPINYGLSSAVFSVDNPDIRLLMGGDDGFLRFIQNTGSNGSQLGVENWAFIPRSVLPVLDRLRRNFAGTPVHPTGVDGTAEALSIDANGDGSIRLADGDRVYAMVGLRRGGKAYYGFDITSPGAPRLLWRIDKSSFSASYAELGQSWGTPSLGFITVSGTTVPAFVIAGGYNGDDGSDNVGDLGKDAKNRSTRIDATPALGTDDDEGNAIFIGNLQTGQLIWKATLGTGGFQADSKTYLHDSMRDSFADATVAIDTTGNGIFDRVYAADTGGVLWRIDLGGFTDHDSDPGTPPVLTYDNPSAWQVNRLLSVGRHSVTSPTISIDRRFFNRADVAQTRDGNGPFDAVVIGSGDREDPFGTFVLNRFYVVKDRATTSGNPCPSLAPGQSCSLSPLTDADLADVTSTCLTPEACAPDSTLLRSGWRLDLTGLGEKNLAPALTAGGSIFFTTFIPPLESTDTCSLNEGRGQVYAVSLANALPTKFTYYDSQADASVPSRVDALEAGGIPVQVVPLGEGKILIQGQQGNQNITSVPGRTSFKTYWYESYR